MNKRLHDARIRKGWSQEEAAEQAQVSVRTYQRWEHGTHSPNFESRKLLREAFGCSDADLGFVELLYSDDDRQILLLTSEEEAAISDLLRLGGTTAMVLFDKSKRDALAKLMKIAGATIAAPQILTTAEPWERLAHAQTSSSPSQETYAYFESMIASCWGLSNNGELDVSGQMLSTFLPKMLQLAPQHKEAARLASQGLRLQSVLTAHNLRLQDKVAFCEQAVEHARLSGEGNTLVSALTELAVAHKYAKQPEKSLRTYQEALTYVDQASPLLQSRVYAASASAFAKTGRKREARFYIELAQETFPSRADRDPVAALADYGKYLLIFYTGSVHLDLGEYEQAWHMFGTVNDLGIVVPERNRLEIRNQQGRAAIMLRDLDRYAECFDDGLTSALALKSKKRYDEAINIFTEEMPTDWLKEDPIQHIIERFQLQKNR
ncbi:hypothetical protein KSF_048400 [Reticulibacter mediterranei]|uniref:HTH cro/C1-type domain-containing protein n=1 Tax=Reticulibacter mediterranei TaxID=2778369 RepID=A0A8J3N1Z5_9CHLR|nr:helix-turn-helix transcriptional regulator [Reticulibacter mediterranei]GHO94792.1 hypothetical protein KSF_048400 [Reticulibacter mediterranei]